METLLAIIGILFEIALIPVKFVLTLGLFFFVLFNLGGAIFGFETDSSACRALHNETQTNLEYYFFPVATYACKPNGGLLQPGLSNFVNWLGAPRKTHESHH